MRYFVRFSYKGTNFHGWQRQPNGMSVQEAMEDAFSLIFSYPIALTGAGRTDAGVHAKNMAAHFDTTNEYSEAELMNFTNRLNSYLPSDIAIHSIYPVSGDMHARFSAIRRTYEYHVTEQKDPFNQEFAIIVPRLDYQAMNQAASILLEETDFASFCKVHTDVKTTICKVEKAIWEQKGDEWVFTITADRFLRNMVRAIVGTLFDIGKGKITLEQFRQIIKQHHRTAAGNSVPAKGLLLLNVEY